MSELNNPLFEDQKEFLERQKQEYKNALLSDVQELKSQSQKVGKTILLAGGAIAGVWMLSTLFRGKKKSKKLITAPARTLSGPATPPAQALVLADGSINYQDALHQEPGHAGTYPPAPSPLQEITHTFLQSDLAKAISQQLTAFLLIYITKKIEEYLHNTQNTQAGLKDPETKDIDFSYHEEDAV
jgi:hypothetical protein